VIGLPSTEELQRALRRAGVPHHELEQHFDGASVHAIAGDVVVIEMASWLTAPAWRSHQNRLQAAARELLQRPDARVVLRDEHGRLTPGDVLPADVDEPQQPPPAATPVRLDADAWTRDRPYRRTRRGRKGAADRLTELDTIGIWTPLAAHMPVVRDPHARFTAEKPLEYRGVEGTGFADFTPTLMHLRVATIGLASLARSCALQNGMILASVSLLGRAIGNRSPRYAESSRLRNVLYDLAYGRLEYRSPYGPRHTIGRSPVLEVLHLTADGDLRPLREVWQPDPEHADRGAWLIAPADSGADETLAIAVAPEILAAAHATDDELGDLATLVSRPAALHAGRALPELLRIAARAPNDRERQIKRIYLATPMTREFGYFAASEPWRVEADIHEDLTELAALPAARLEISSTGFTESGHRGYEIRKRQRPARGEADARRVPARRRRRAGQPTTGTQRRIRPPMQRLARPPARSRHLPPASAGRLRARISALSRGGEEPPAAALLRAA